MDAILFSAGLGTRLKPLTDTVPKPLIKVCGKPLIEWNLRLISQIGVQKVWVNTHYLPEQIVDYLEQRPKDRFDIQILHEPILLDTGGTLKKVMYLSTSDDFLLWNSDVLLDPAWLSKIKPGYDEFFEDYRKSGDLFHLLVKSQKMDFSSKEAGSGAYTSLGIDSDRRLVRFLGESYGSKVTKDSAIYTGISLCSKAVTQYFPEKRIFSWTKEVLPKVLSANSSKIGVSFCNVYWNDVGTIERLESASKCFEDILSLHQTP